MKFEAPIQSSREAELSVIAYARPDMASGDSTTLEGTRNTFEYKEERSFV